MSDLISRQAVLGLKTIAPVMNGEVVRYEEVVFVRDLEKLSSVDPEQKSRECASCKHSNNGECAYTEECHKCMWESQYERQVEPERKKGKWEYIQYDGSPKIGNWHCSNCRLIVNLGFEGAPYYDYCPECGAKMEVEE